MDQSGITPNTSNQQLVVNNDNESESALLQKQSKRPDSLRDLTRYELMTVAILCFVNLINYMDRLTVAGVLDDVKTEFQIGDDKAGLLQTVFVVAYMAFAPLFGFLGDRYSRRWIMAFGVAMWGMTTFVGSFAKTFPLFAFFRGMVGIGEASYSTIAPTIISDLFVGNLRSKMLAFFYFAIPVGSGMGYIVGSMASQAAENWRWGLRVTPFMSIVAVFLILYVMIDPERGMAEDSHMTPTSYKEDVQSLMKNKSFMLSTIAFTCVAFVTGALSWWGPQFIFLGLKLQDGSGEITNDSVAYRFGIVAMVAGALGVPLGSWLAQRLRPVASDCDPLVCAAALLVSAPLVYFALIAVSAHAILTYFLIFLGMVTLNLTWSIVADIVLYVVIPPRRSTAEAFQILISHTFGDAGSPYLVGVISEALKISLSKPNETPTQITEFRSLQYALFVTCFVEVLGGLFFFLTAIYITKDKMKVDRLIAEAEAQSTNPHARSALAR